RLVARRSNDSWCVASSRGFDTMALPRDLLRAMPASQTTPQVVPARSPNEFRSWAARHSLFFLVLIASAWYAGGNVERGWISHDDGALAQGAERLLHGELPHRDFVEIYTGALDYVHAFAFRAFGTTFSSMRLVLFAAFLVWLPVFYRLALFLA